MASIDAPPAPPPAPARRVAQIQANFAAHMRMFAGTNGVEVVDDDVTWIVSQTGAPGTLVMRAEFDEAAADRRVDEVVERIGRHTPYFEWLVFPGDRPSDLAARVAARGAAGGPAGEWELVGEIGGAGGAWMTAELADLRPLPEPAAPVRIRPVTDLAMLETWRAVSSAGFGGGAYREFFDAYARQGFAADAGAVHYVGDLDGRPATAGTLVFAGGSAGVYNVSTPPGDRRQGLGAAVTHAMMQAARERGHDWAWLHSSKLGRGVYERLGFTEVAIGAREYCWKRKGT